MEHNDGEEVYIGISAENKKQRLYNHRHSFSNPRLRNQTARSEYFWSLKNHGLIPQVKLEIARQSSTANSFNGRCNFCIDEKICILLGFLLELITFNSVVDIIMTGRFM